MTTEVVLSQTEDGGEEKTAGEEKSDLEMGSFHTAAADTSTADGSGSDSGEKSEESPLKSNAGGGSKAPPLKAKQEKDRDSHSPPPELHGIEKVSWIARHEIVYHPLFEPFILFVIVVNCVFLALDNPERSSQRLRKTINVSEYVFTTIYLAEMLVKMIAFNLFGHHSEVGLKEVEQAEQKKAAMTYMLNSAFKRKKETKVDDNSYVGYFLDGWNVLDFVVVMIGSVIPLFFGTNSVSSIRALRILRAVRTIPRVPKLRILVMTLIDSLMGLSVSLILLAFFFVVFGIIGVDFFRGKLQKHCYLNGVTDTKATLLQYQAGDSMYYAVCASDSTCAHIVEDYNYAALGYPTTYTCEDGDRNPNSNMESFDDIFYSLLMVFQTVTLQDWSRVLYDLHERTGYVAWVWFVPLIFLVSFFALNLLLAVIAVTYANSRKVVQHEEDFSDNLDEVDLLIAAKDKAPAGSSVKMKITYDNYERYIRVLKQKVSMFEELFQEFSQPAVETVAQKYELTKRVKLRVDTAHRDEKEARDKWAAELTAIEEDVKAESTLDLGLMDEDRSQWQYSNRAEVQREIRSKMIHETMASFNSELARAVWQLAKPIPDAYLENKGQFVLWCNKIAVSELFEKAMLFVIMLNTIVLGVWWPSMPKTLERALVVVNLLFTAIFTIELIVKAIGLGWDKWKYDHFNVFDGVIVLVSLIDIVVSVSSGSDTGLSGAILAFRALRVLRILRLLHQIRSLRILLNSIIQSFEPVIMLFLIMSLFLFMFAVLGVQMFAGKVMKYKRTDEFLMLTRPWRFDTLWYSLVTSVQLFSGDGWPAVMGDLVQATSPAACVVPIAAVVIGLWIFKNMFLAILINRMGNQDDIQFLIDDLIREARQLQVRYEGDINEGTQRCVDIVDAFRRKRMVSKAGNRHLRRVKKMERRQKIIGTSLMYFRPDNGVRVWLHNEVVSTDWFEYTINGMIVLNCVFLALRNPRVDKSSIFGKALTGLDFVFTFIFVVELILKVICLGLYESASSAPSQAREADALRSHHKKGDAEEGEDSAATMASKPCANAYLNSWWNRMDALVVFFAILGLIFPSVAFLRGLRAVRPIRIAIRIEQVRVVVKALNASLSNIFNGVLFAFFLMFVLSIIGVHLFGGKLHRCVVKGSPYQLADGINNKKQCLETDGFEWINAGFNFDNVFAGLLTVFKISNFSNWFEDLAIGMAARKDDLQAKPFGNPAAALYYILVVFCGGFFLWNILISVVVDSFNRIKRDEESNALLTKTQAMWVRKKRYLSRFQLKNEIRAPKRISSKLRFASFRNWILPMRKRCFALVTKTWFEYFIMALILLNTVFLMSQHENEPKMWERTLFFIELLFVGLYTFEAILKLLGLGVVTYFRDWWNVFDFVIVVLSIVGYGFTEASGAAVVRLLRVARLARLIKRAPALRAQFLTLVFAIPSLANIGFLLFVIFFIFGIFGVELFGKVYHNDGYGNALIYNGNDGITASVNFEDFSRSLLILYRVATNDNWGSVLLAAGAQGNLCQGAKEQKGDFNYECGNMALSVLFFVLFGIFGTLVMINLFIAVILDTYQDNISFETKMDKLMAPQTYGQGAAEQWMEVWKQMDATENGGAVRGRLPVKNFIGSLKQSPRVIGLMLESLGLRLNVEDASADDTLDYNNPENYEEIERRSTDAYGRLEFVGSANALDGKVLVTNDHLNAIFKTRRLRVLCTLIHRGTINEKLVVYYADALFALASLVVGPEFRLLPYDTAKYVHVSDWWDEQLEEAMPSF